MAATSVTEVELAVRKACRETLWREGRQNEYLLDEGQRRWIARFRAHKQHGVWKIGRQRGKSFAALAMAVEDCSNRPGTVVRYAAQTGKSAKAIVVPTLKIILEDCPPELLPVEKEDQGEYRFPNGSVIVWAGTDNDQFERLRGPYAHLILLDEAAFYAKLEDVESALLKQLITTGGQALYLSSPPKSPGHPFTTRYRGARASGCAEMETIEDNPRLTPADVNDILQKEANIRAMSLEEYRKSTDCRREYYAEDVIEESVAAAPAWTEPVRIECTAGWSRPQHFDGYTAHDWGGQTGDPHAALFGFVDFKASKLIIEDEHEKRGGDMRQLSDDWKAKEVALWGERAWDGTLYGAGEFEKATRPLPDFLKKVISDKAPRQPYLRVCDNDDNLQQEMLGHGYGLLASEKHDKHIWVDNMNRLLRERRIIIHPRCKRLLEQLGTTIWDERRRQWVRTAADHGDLIDCLVYMARNVRWNRDPAPPVLDAWQAEVQRLQGQQQPKGLETLFARRVRR